MAWPYKDGPGKPQKPSTCRVCLRKSSTMGIVIVDSDGKSYELEGVTSVDVRMEGYDPVYEITLRLLVSREDIYNEPR